jgi:hypothetical protein
MNPCYFNFELIQKKTAFKFEIGIWFDKWALAHLTQPAHLARLSQTGSGLGWSTDPAQPPHSLPSPPRALWRTLNRRRRRPVIPAISGGFHH